MSTKTKTGYKITLPSDKELVMTRTFNAPRALVFKAHTDPALIPQWWGPHNYTTTVEKMDVRPGGAWRFVQRGADGFEIAFWGEFREIVPPEYFAWTFGFDGIPGGEPGLEKYVFEEHDGKTTLISTAYFNSVEEREGMLASGMESGANESAEKLDDLLERLQA